MIVTRCTRPHSNPERRSAWAARYFQAMTDQQLGGPMSAIPMDTHRYYRDRQQVEAACRANGLSTAQRESLLQSFRAEWYAASNTVARQRVTAAACDRAAQLGPGPGSPGGPATGRAPLLAAA